MFFIFPISLLIVKNTRKLETYQYNDLTFVHRNSLAIKIWNHCFWFVQKWVASTQIRTQNVIFRSAKIKTHPNPNLIVTRRARWRLIRGWRSQREMECSNHWYFHFVLLGKGTVRTLYMVLYVSPVQGKIKCHSNFDFLFHLFNSANNHY